MKNSLYVATVCRAYRDAIDLCLRDRKAYRERIPWYLEQVSNCTHRDFGTGFFYGRPGSDGQVYQGSPYHKESVYLGIAGDEAGTDGCSFWLEQKNKFSVGDMIEVMGFDGQDCCLQVLSIQDSEGREQESAPHAKQMVRVTVSAPVVYGEVLRSARTVTGS